MVAHGSVSISRLRQTLLQIKEIKVETGSITIEPVFSKSKESPQTPHLCILLLSTSITSLTNPIPLCHFIPKIPETLTVGAFNFHTYLPSQHISDYQI